jgi:hypothetical protein
MRDGPDKVDEAVAVVMAWAEEYGVEFVSPSMAAGLLDRLRETGSDTDPKSHEEIERGA